MSHRPGFWGRVLPASLAALACWVCPTSAQLQSASAAGLGTADNYTARARGFAALGLNPAALGLASSPDLSLALLPVRIRAGLDPITLGDLANFEGKRIPDATKNDWLERIASSGGQRILAGARATAVSLTVGHFGFQASTLAYAQANLAEPVAELLLFGNAGRTGSPADLVLTGSSMDAWAVTTVGASVGLPLHTKIGDFGSQSFAVGATLKYSVGNALLMGRETRGSVSSDPIEVNVEFPVIQTEKAESGYDNGTGVGLDVGAAWEGGPWSVGLALRNLLNSFRWDRSKLFFRPGRAIFNESDKKTDLDAVRAQSTPAAGSLLSEVAGQKFDPTLAVGAAYAVSATATLMGELRNRFGLGIDVGPSLHIGAGVELHPWSVLRLRAGAAKITNGLQLGTGGTLTLGPVNVSGAYLRQSGSVGDASFGQLTLSWGGF